jgi:hypothetical protein
MFWINQRLPDDPRKVVTLALIEESLRLGRWIER